MLESLGAQRNVARSSLSAGDTKHPLFNVEVCDQASRELAGSHRQQRQSGEERPRHLSGSGNEEAALVEGKEQTATATITARNAAETDITGSGFGAADGTNKSATQLGVTVGSCPSGGCTISFAFDADPFILASLDAAALGGSVASGTLAFSITLTNAATSAVVFSWTPNGSIGSGINGGSETADAENLNLTLSAFPGQTVTHSGPYAAGTFGHYAGVTNALPSGNYTLSIFMNEKTDVQRVAAVPEPTRPR
jgi:hypothetical protein